jgi:type VI secretion system protein ImpK
MNDDDEGPVRRLRQQDRTIIKPSAGPAGPRRRPPAAAAAAPGGRLRARRGAAAGRRPDAAHAHGLNPLVQAAAPLLMRRTRLRATLRHPNPTALRNAAGRRGASGSRPTRARRRAQRAGRGRALRAVHAARRVRGQHALGRLGRLGLAQPAGAVPQRGLGRREGLPAAGQARLDEPRRSTATCWSCSTSCCRWASRAATACWTTAGPAREHARAPGGKLREHAGAPERELSPHWQGVAGGRRAARRHAAVGRRQPWRRWCCWRCSCPPAFTLNSRTNATFTCAAGDGRQVGTGPPPAAGGRRGAAAGGAAETEIDAGQLQVKDLADRSIVTINGDGFFESSAAPRSSAPCGRC